MRTFDTVIVGAGPAGAHAARGLAALGQRVALIDKATFPRDKVCGGGLSKKTLDLLDCDLGGIVEQSIRGAFITYRNRAKILKDMPGVVGATVCRAAFDTFLVERAVDAGAVFMPGNGFRSCRENRSGIVVDTTSGEVLYARRLLAADGVGSAVRSAVFGRDVVSYAPAVEALLYLESDGLERYSGRVVFDLGGIERGYGWIFPKRDHVNVGVYSAFGSRGLNRALDAFIARYPSLASARRRIRSGYPIPLRNRKGVYERGRVWLLGDAAGCAESVYGEGIYFALCSAQLAVDVCAAAQGDPGPGRYGAAVKSVLEPQLRYSERIARGLYAFQTFAFERLARNRAINDQFAGLIFGDVTHKDCFYRTLFGLPRWLLAGRHPLVDDPPL